MFIVLGVRSLDLSCAVEIYIWTLIDVSPSQGSYHQLLLPQDVKVSHLTDQRLVLPCHWVTLGK